MNAKEFILDKIENEWTQDLRDTCADNIDKLAEAFDEYAGWCRCKEPKFKGWNGDACKCSCGGIYIE